MLPPQQGRDDSLRVLLAQGREGNLPKRYQSLGYPRGVNDAINGSIRKPDHRLNGEETKPGARAGFTRSSKTDTEWRQSLTAARQAWHVAFVARAAGSDAFDCTGPLCVAEIRRDLPH
jgi:hypothetical protein